jgi:HSP20 family protein
MTDATAIPLNIFENDRELVVTAPMPGIAPTDIAIEVTDDGHLTLRAAERGPGQERIEYLRREWSYGPYQRTVPLPCCVDAGRANVAYGNGVLTVTFPKAEATSGSLVRVDSTGHARGVAVGHPGERGGSVA